MGCIVRGGMCVQDGELVPDTLFVSDGRFAPCFSPARGDELVDASGLTVLPGFADVHVHLREPGYSYKETVATGTAAAARGGYTAVCPMPNVDPVPDILDHLEVQREIIRRSARVRVLPYGSISRGERGEALSDMAALAPYVAGFSDDGRGVQSESLMRQAMAEARRLGKVIAAHCEDNALLRGGYIHDGAYARAHGHRGICSESEWGQVRRDLALARETGCAYHVCHISTRESVDLIRRAKAEGVDVTCETAPHYLLLDETALREDGRFKMNPPLRTPADREALVEGLLDGTVDMIATDHAPHSAEEKSRGLAGSLMGVVGLETAFSLLYTCLVKPGVLSLAALVDKLCAAPRRRFGLGGALAEGEDADFSLWDLEEEYVIDPEEFQSRGRATPFAGWKVFGRCRRTFCGGETVWRE